MRSPTRTSPPSVPYPSRWTTTRSTTGWGTCRVTDMFPASRSSSPRTTWRTGWGEPCLAMTTRITGKGLRGAGEQGKGFIFPTLCFWPTTFGAAFNIRICKCKNAIEDYFRGGCGNNLDNCFIMKASLRVNIQHFLYGIIFRFKYLWTSSLCFKSFAKQKYRECNLIIICSKMFTSLLNLFDIYWSYIPK